MQKKLKSLLIAASSIVAATLVFIACGSGQIIEIADSVWDETKDHSEINLYSSVLAYLPSSEVQLPSSSSVDEPPQPLSSANQPSSSAVIPQSSAVIPQSSTGGGEPPPSSAVVPKSSSSNVPKSSAAAASGCKESSPKSGFTCGWSISGSSTTPGKPLTHANAATPSGCSSIAWKYVDDNDDLTLLYDCRALPEAGLTTEGSKKYLLFAELTCDDGKHTTACNKTPLSTLRAPGLTGTCEWKKSNGDKVTETTTARGAIPGGVSLVDNDKVCGTTAPSVVYKYDGGTKTWPKEGGPIPEAKTYTDVQATVACPAFDVVPTTCPALTVKGGADYQMTCTGGQISATTCNKVEQKLKSSDECIDLEINWDNANYLPTITMTCEGQFTGNNPTSSISVKVGTKPSVSASKDYYVSVSTDLLKLKVGTNEVLGICVSYTTTGSATGVTCKLGNK